jgi:hypothetical protein
VSASSFSAESDRSCRSRSRACSSCSSDNSPRAHAASRGSARPGSSPSARTDPIASAVARARAGPSDLIRRSCVRFVPATDPSLRGISDLLAQVHAACRVGQLDSPASTRNRDGPPVSRPPRTPVNRRDGHPPVRAGTELLGVQPGGVLEEVAQRCAGAVLLLERLGGAAQRAQVLEHPL